MRAPILPPRQAIELPKRRNDLTLGQYVECYLASRDVTPDYQVAVRSQIAVFIQWYGSDIKIADLSCDVVNEWLSVLLMTHLSPSTVSSYRRTLRAVWWSAYQEGDSENPPLRLKKIRVPQQRIEAFTHEEITMLLIAAGGLRGFFDINGVRRSAFWQASIHAAYSTGLRRGDLLAVKRSQIADDGTTVVVQSKTGYRVCVCFSPDAMRWIDKICVDGDDRALTWPHHPNAMHRQFRAIMKLAGISRGQFRWLRRSAGSYAEAAQPGSGSRMLGHRTLAVFNNHYNDESISVSQPIAPPPVVRPTGRPRSPKQDRLPPTVRIAKQKTGNIRLCWLNPATLKQVSISTGTLDEAKALEQKAALEAKLLREIAS